MTDRDLSVAEMVEAERTRDPDASVEDLHWLAARIDPAMRQLSGEEFAARFLSASASGSEKRSKPTRHRKTAPRPAESPEGSEVRDVVRRALLTFAAEVAAADDRHSVVVAMGGVERHVERIVRSL